MASFFFFGDDSAVDYHVFFGRIQFDNAAADLLLDQLLHLGCVSHAAARGRHEGSHSHVYAEPALNHARHRAHYGCFVGESLLQPGPVSGTLHFSTHQLVVTLRIAPFDGHQELHPRLHRIISEGRKRQDAFALEADVEQNRIRSDRDDSTLELLGSFCGWFARVALLVLGKNFLE